MSDANLSDTLRDKQQHIELLEGALAGERAKCIAELEQLVKVVDAEQWEARPLQRMFISGIKLAIRELQGNKRPR
jgi:hypothetical protein